MRFFCFLLATVLYISISFGQDFSNKGKDFWLGYGYHVRFVTNGGGGGAVNAQEMVLYFATENIPGTFTNIKIEIPSVGYVDYINNVPAGTIATSQPIPKTGTQDARLTAEGTYNKGIHITSDRPVVAYAHIYNGNVSGATLLFPTNTLGKEYYSINYKQISNEDFSNGFFFVVAADTGVTTVEITPSAATQLHPANVPFTITLNQGEIYNVMGQLTGGSSGNYSGSDLTGSKIRSLSVGGVFCKRIAVFSGSGKMKISCSNAGSSDNLIAQAFPKTAWGKKFITVPTAGMPYNYFRVAVSDPTSIVTVNGVQLFGLQNNFYYDLPLTNQTQVIESNQPIMVSQYITTTGTCGNTFISTGDPDMIYLSPVEQTIDEVVLNSAYQYAITQHYINVVIKTTAVPSFRVTGAITAPSFQLLPQDAQYSYAQINVNSGSHTLSADSGFNAIAYGYGSTESYAYNAGTNLKDLYNFVAPYNPLNISRQNTACACTPFYYTITLPFQPLSLFWDFKGYQTPNAMVNNPVSDSTYFINGKQVWRYRLPDAYTYCPAGNYPLSITAGTSGTDGCGNFQVKDDTLYVKNTPNPQFSWTNTGCVSDSVYFSDNTTYEDGVYSYKWFWDFGDGTTSTLQNPAHKYLTAGTYTVRFQVITNIGCVSSFASLPVTVTDPPVAKFGVGLPLCEGAPIVFLDSSLVAPPSIIRNWYFDYGDGMVDTFNRITNVVHTFSGWGPQRVTLKVVSSSGCTSALFTKNFTVNPKPVADFVMPAIVCLPFQSAQFNDASAIADNSQSGFVYKWNFGEPISGSADSSNLKNPAHLYQGVGPFNVLLTVTSNNGCKKDTTKVFNNVYPRPTANFLVAPENCLLTNTNFTDNSNGQGSSITNWYYNYDDGSAVIDQQSPAHTFSLADTFYVKHWIKTDKGCLSDTVVKPVIVNPLPVAGFRTNAPLCATKSILLTDTSRANVGNIVKWTWNFGLGNPDSVLSSSTPFNYVFANAGTYTVTLNIETDKGCKNTIPFVKNITISPLPVAGFISPEVCLNDASALFVDTSSIASGSIVSYAWDFGDPTSGTTLNASTLQNPSHKYNAIGNYTATLTVTSDKGCVVSAPQSFTVNGDNPVARIFKVNNLICSTDSVVIRDSSTVNFGNVTKVIITWDFLGASTISEVDNLPFNGKIYKHLFPAFQNPLTNTYKIRYQAFSGATCSDDVFLDVVINANPKVQFLPIPDICLDAVPYQIAEATETGGVPGTSNYTGIGVSNAGLFSTTGLLPNIYGLKYIYTSLVGCKDSASSSIKILQPPVAKFGFSSPLCAAFPVTFSDSSTSTAGSIVNWSWSFGTGIVPVSQSSNSAVTHAYPLAGSYDAVLTVTTINGCKASSMPKTVFIHPNPTASFTYPANICLPAGLANFTDQSTITDGTENSFTYKWNFGDVSSGVNNTSVLKNPSHNFSTVGPYTVVLNVTSGQGCKDDTLIVVNRIRLEPKANFTSDSVSICASQQVRFIDRSLIGSGPLVSWEWNFGDGQIFSPGQNPPPHLYVTANTYQVTLKIQDSYGCTNVSAPKSFIVYPYPIISAGNDTVLLEGGQIVLNATASGNDLRYLWQPPLSLSSATILNPMVSGLTDDITYNLQVVARGGCTRTDKVEVTLLKSPQVPNTFSPNNDGVNDNWVIQYLDSYPNCHIQVFNRQGQLVYESNQYIPPGWDGSYRGKSLPFGTYYYIIEPGSGRKPITGYVTLIK